MKKGKLLNVAVIGAGYFGGIHSNVYEASPIANLVAVCDLNKEACDKLVAEINKKRSPEDAQCKAIYSTDQLFSELGSQIDACSVCTSEHYHYDAAKPVIEAGKALLLEKPVAQNYETGKKILDLAKEKGTRLMIGQVLHFDPKYQIAQQKVRDGEFGQITNMYLERTGTDWVPKRLNGAISMFHYSGVHDFDAMLTFANGAKPIKAYSVAVNKSNAKYHNEKSQNEGDATFSTITFDNGTIAVIHINWAQPSPSLSFVARAHIFGEKGTAFIDLKNQGLDMYINDSPEDFPELTYWPDFNGSIQGAVKDEILHFCDATINEKPYIIDNEQALMAVKVIDACRESIKTGMPVEIK